MIFPQICAFVVQEPVDINRVVPSEIDTTLEFVTFPAATATLRLFAEAPGPFAVKVIAVAGDAAAFLSNDVAVAVPVVFVAREM